MILVQSELAEQNYGIHSFCVLGSHDADPSTIGYFLFALNVQTHGSNPHCQSDPTSTTQILTCFSSLVCSNPESVIPPGRQDKDYRE